MSLTKPIIPLTRRRFLAAAGVAAAAAKAQAFSSVNNHDSRFAYAASHDLIRVYSTQTIPWIQTQSIPSEAPISLVADPNKHVLHVLHDVAEYQGFPRGYIESFRIDPHNGRISLLSQQPLSLSAIHPRHMSLSPDCKTLAIAVQGGSAYNLLPILEDGRPGRPIGIRKETGLGTSSPARPGKIAFSNNGDRIFALDEGMATLSVFAAQPELPLLARFRFPSRINPTHFVMNPDERSLFATNPHSDSLHLLHYDPHTHDLQASQLSLPSGFDGAAYGPCALHARSGTFLTAVNNTLCIFKFNPHVESFSLRQTINLPHRAVRELILPTDGEAVYALTDNETLRLAVDRHQNTLERPEVVGPAVSTVAFL